MSKPTKSLVEIFTAIGEANIAACKQAIEHPPEIPPNAHGVAQADAVDAMKRAVEAIGGSVDD